MGKNLATKITLITVLVIAGILLVFGGAVSTIYIAGKVRMWILTRDMTGGTSLVYEIDVRGLSEQEKKFGEMNLSNLYSKKRIFVRIKDGDELYISKNQLLLSKLTNWIFILRHGKCIYGVIEGGNQTQLGIEAF